MRLPSRPVLVYSKAPMCFTWMPGAVDVDDQRCVTSGEGSIGIAVDGRDFVTRARYYAIVLSAI